MYFFPNMDIVAQEKSTPAFLGGVKIHVFLCEASLAPLNDPKALCVSNIN
jgi:hypothetical protein